MIAVQQRISASGGDDALPGDCLKCCIASILELPYEDVPHFVAREVTKTDLDGTVHRLDWLTGVNHWLATNGWPLRLKHWTNNVTADEMFALRKAKGLEPGQSCGALDVYRRSPHPDWQQGWWIATVVSENFAESTHAIVMLDDKVMFDPSTKPRRTPYEFVGGKIFVAADPARCRP